MKPLLDNKLLYFVKMGKKLSEMDGTVILDNFERNQPDLYQSMFGIFADGITETDNDMANFFLELCCDIIIGYKLAFGNITDMSKNADWLNKQSVLLNAELNSIDVNEPMNSKFKDHLNNRLVDRSIESGLQLELLKYLNDQVKDYASFKPSRRQAIHETNNLLFVVVRLMDDIYNSVKK